MVYPSKTQIITILLMLMFAFMWAWEVSKTENNLRREIMCWETLESCKQTLHSCDALVKELHWRIQK
jgi:predicted small integral membrane protein